MDSSVIYFLAGVAVVALLLFAIILFTKKGPSTLNQQRYQSAWLAIELAFKKDQESSYPMSVLEADKLLDKALKERGFTGQTMGERMKAAQKTWSNANAVWTAHKLRNRIAHETNVNVTYNAAAHALIAFKRGLKDLGAF